jgi:hypothetical protein
MQYQCGFLRRQQLGKHSLVADQADSVRAAVLHAGKRRNETIL